MNEIKIVGEKSSVPDFELAAKSAAMEIAKFSGQHAQTGYDAQDGWLVRAFDTHNIDQVSVDQGHGVSLKISVIAL